MEPIEVSTDSEVKYTNSMQGYIFGAFSNLEFYSHNFLIVMVIYWGDIFLLDYHGWNSLEDYKKRLSEIS